MFPIVKHGSTSPARRLSYVSYSSATTNIGKWFQRTGRHNYIIPLTAAEPPSGGSTRQKLKAWSVKLTFKDLCEQFQKLVKEFIPAIILVLYSLIGAGIVFALDANIGPKLSETHGPTNQNLCVGAVGYLGALYYVNTLYTTIGYGNVYPCNPGSKAFSVIYTLIGIPLVFIVLDTTGRMFSIIVAKIWRIIRKFVAQKVSFRKKRLSSIVKPFDFDEDEEEGLHLPVYLGILLTLVWILLCAWFFSISENWPFEESIYFVMITVLTIGLGDYAPIHYDSAIANFAAVIVGLALVSMSIKIVQDNIEGLFIKFQKQLQDEYKRRMLQGEEGGALDSGEGDRKKKGWMGALMTDKQKKELQAMKDQQSRMRIRGVQAVVTTHEQQIDATADMATMGIQHVPFTTDRKTQVFVMQQSVDTQIDIEFQREAAGKEMRDSWTNMAAGEGPVQWFNSLKDKAALDRPWKY